LKFPTHGIETYYYSRTSDFNDRRRGRYFGKRAQDSAGGPTVSHLPEICSLCLTGGWPLQKLLALNRPIEPVALQLGVGPSFGFLIPISVSTGTVGLQNRQEEMRAEPITPKIVRVREPGWLSRWSLRLLISTQVLISGSWVQALLWALHWAGA